MRDSGTCKERSRVANNTRFDLAKPYQRIALGLLLMLQACAWKGMGLVLIRGAYA